MQAIAMPAISLFPSEIAEKIAARSAHIVKPYDAFSIFVPRYTLPPANTAAPTLNFEWGL